MRTDGDGEVSDLVSGGDAMPERRRELAEWRRERIIDAAMSVFGGKGVDAASMKDVAAAAGVTPGLLYHYFAGKEALVLAVISERGFLPELRLLLSTSEQRPARVVLPEVLTGFHRILAERAELIGLFLSGATTNPNIRQGLQEFVTEGQQLLGAYLSDRVAAGELRPHDPRAVAHVLLSSCVLGHVIGAPADPSTVVDVVLDGLTVRTDSPDHGGRSMG
jgi:AcrR family transcriptional regulator